MLGGDGPPILLLHGYPQTHVMWHKIAPELARHFTVVASDLRGYGDSSKPRGGAPHIAYSKRTLAQDQVEAMSALGFETFFVAGHDRGARVGYRMALDHQARVGKLALMDIVPTWEQFARADKGAAMGSYHWYFLAQPEPLPETLIGAGPEYFLRHTLESWCKTPDSFTPEALDEYLRCFKDPDTIHASCEDYRAGATIDCDHDEADHDRQARITCPLLVLWGELGRPHKRRDVIEVWRTWADDVGGGAIACGHFLPEEAPAETTERLLAFFGA